MLSKMSFVKLCSLFYLVKIFLGLDTILQNFNFPFSFVSLAQGCSFSDYENKQGSKIDRYMLS